MTNFFSALICTFVGIHQNSSAVIFDAFYCFFLSIGSFLLILMSKKLTEPPNRAFQYGYDKFEPLMVFLQAAVIFVSCLYAGLSAIQDFIHPHEVKNFLVIVRLEFVLLTLSSLMYFMCRWYAKRFQNQILKVQAFSWYADSLQSLVLLLAFGFGSISHTMHLQWLGPYIDPIALLFLVLSIIREPAHFLRVSLVELLDGIYPGGDYHQIEIIIKEFMQRRHMPILVCRFRKAGKKLYIRLQVPPSTDINLEQLSKVQKDLNAYLKTTRFNYFFDAILVVDDGREIE